MKEPSEDRGAYAFFTNFAASSGRIEAVRSGVITRTGELRMLPGDRFFHLTIATGKLNLN